MTETCGPVSFTDAPIPFEISMPSAVIAIFAPVEVSRVIPPMPGVSSRRTLWPPSVTIITFFEGGGGASSFGGTSTAEPHQQPDQIG